jgi:hypothetical protein
LVSSIIEIKDDEVYGVVTGFSGAESGYGVRHTEEQFKRAHALVLVFVKEGQILLHPEFKDSIVYRYLLKE